MQPCHDNQSEERGGACSVSAHEEHWNEKSRDGPVSPSEQDVAYGAVPVEFLVDDEAAVFDRYTGAPSTAELEQAFVLDTLTRN